MRRFIEGSLTMAPALLVIAFMSSILSCQGKRGDIGPSGPQGQSGPTGQTGAAGQDGTEIIMVVLCPGYPPTSFPEYGFCLSGKLYAEYYAPPSSGLVYLPDGNYVSTQTGAPCSFTVETCLVH